VESNHSEGPPPRAIRSPFMDDIQTRLLASDDAIERATGIALYSLRPPRSRKDWAKIGDLLRHASADDVTTCWSWALNASAQVTNRPEVWSAQIATILEEGVPDHVSVMLCDTIRVLLSQESQSVSEVASGLGLPAVTSEARGHR
jgi:hypothetical protein